MKRKKIILLSICLTVSGILGLVGFSQAQAEKALQRTNPVAATPESIAQGKSVFFEFCSGCHGKRADGKGSLAVHLDPKPQNLRNAPFVRYLTDERMFTSISGGVRGTGMPAFELQIKTPYRWHVINYIRSLTAGYTLEIPNAQVHEKVEPGIKNPLTASAESAARGETLYRRYCSSCHGEKIDGRGPVSENLRPRPRNLVVVVSWGEKPFINYLPDSRVFDSIRNGVPGTSMSPWNQVFAAQDTWHIINFLRTKAKGAAPPTYKPLRGRSQR